MFMRVWGCKVAGCARLPCTSGKALTPQGHPGPTICLHHNPRPPSKPPHAAWCCTNTIAPKLTTRCLVPPRYDKSICMYEFDKLDKPKEAMQRIRKCHSAAIVSMAFDHYNNTIITGSIDGSMKVWSMEGRCAGVRGKGIGRAIGSLEAYMCALVASQGGTACKGTAAPA